MLLEKLNNIILNTDAYKTTHYLQLPENAGQMSSYIESRGGKYDAVMSFGLQGFIKEYLSKPITKEFIDEGEKYISGFLGLPFNRKGWEHILEKHNGYLPLEIETVAEGTVVPTHNVTVQITNTDPECAWLPGYIETALLRSVWYCNTVATKSLQTKNIIKEHMLKSCDNLGKLPWMLNDFGARAATSAESSALGGMSHLVNFAGSDTIMGIVAADLYYDYKPEFQGVPAAEHSTITSWGKENEKDAYRNMMKQFAGDGKIVAVVSDSYDLYNAIENIWGGELKDEVINNGGTIVVRPDSGDPVEVVCKSLELLEKQFGVTNNTKGFKVLPPYIRLIQGDGVNPESIDAILIAMEKKGYSADNIVFGMGGELMQKLDRDTQKYAMKAAAVRLNKMEEEFQNYLEDVLAEKDIDLSAFDGPANWKDVYKDPITDPGKQSKRGVQALTFDENKGYITCRRDELNGRENLLQTIYRNGKLMTEVTFDQVRQTAEETNEKLIAFRQRTQPKVALVA
jgi:nicotinamide phosphoribosyltransferase